MACVYFSRPSVRFLRLHSRDAANKAHHYLGCHFGPGIRDLRSRDSLFRMADHVAEFPGDLLLFFTDGLTDSIADVDSEARMQTMLKGEKDIKKAIVKLRSLMDAKLIHDDVTIVLVARLPLSSGTPTGD